MVHRHYRAHQRFPVRLSALIRAHSRDCSVRADVTDLGLGGLAAEADGPLRHGEMVLIVLETPERIELNGRVAWVAWAERSSVRVGINLTVGDEAALRKLLDRLRLTAEAV